jgi:uncharacterized membrane-anchored protein YitT (DUF2179 family)
MKNSLGHYYTPIKDYSLIIVGTLLIAFGFDGFILSNQIVTGGLTGVCALIFFATKGFIPVSLSFFIINIALLIIALKVLGFKFLIKTIVGVFALSGSFWLFEQLLGGQPILHGQPFMSIVIGAFLTGIGLGLVFSAGGSTGGTDILAAIVNKYKNVIDGNSHDHVRLRHHQQFLHTVSQHRQDRLRLRGDARGELHAGHDSQFEPAIRTVHDLLAEIR